MAVKKKVAARKAPSKVGVLIDQLYLQDQAIHKVESALQKEKQKREALQSKLLDSMHANAIHGARGKLGTAFVKETKHPKIVNYGKLWKYIVSHKAYDLLQKRVASQAYYARREDGEKVPGVKTFRAIRVSVRKAK